MLSVGRITGTHNSTIRVEIVNDDTMLKKIRSINGGWFLVLTGIGIILAGLKMTENTGSGNTLLCFDSGCIYVQGISNIVLGILMFGTGIYVRYFKFK